MTAMK